jgi:hypothetical protein
MKMFIMKILHLIPLVHFYGKWIDRGSYANKYGKQQKSCLICNRKANRLYDFDE